MAEAINYKEAKEEMEKHFQFVAKEIGRDWKKLGRKLKRITKAIIDNIDDEFQSTEEKAYQVLMRWYQANGQAGATKEVLIKALQAIDKTSIAEELVYRDHCDPSYEDGSGNYSNQLNKTSSIQEKIQECAKSPLSPTYNLTPPPSPFPTPNGFNFERFDKELDKMLKYCQKTVAECDRCAFGHMLKVLAHLRELNEIIMVSRNSHERNDDDAPEIAEIKLADRIRSTHIEETMKLITIISSEPEATRVMSDATPRRCTSEIHLPPRSDTDGSAVKASRDIVISSPILSCKNTIQSRDSTPRHNRICGDLMKPKEPEEPHVITRCSDCGSCLHSGSCLHRGVSGNQEIPLDENRNQRSNPGPIQDETTADNEENENSD
ncbi:receptor-interacting serine threonine- kinase 3-like isoform X1 [Paramuricea clavata]|uniref:Receptor-interacting serine threonine- kinase 3-like isoform X1 n=1 Tax=Paramuricea clavata TaxID=317549 RepID=A0A6S7FMM1_PARCT|nr:receptor-interacting serine threonine- kinase 3-like isoform X1 [Paramuricea clavata]